MKSDKKVLIERVLMRASSGLHTLDEVLRDKKGGTDSCFSRTWYILLTLNFELILTGVFLLSTQLKTKKDLISAIPRSHDYSKISKAIETELLKKLGIKSIQPTKRDGFKHFDIHFSDGSIVILNDFVEVRYDFKNDSLRPEDKREVERIKKEIKLLLNLIKKIHIEADSC